MSLSDLLKELQESYRTRTTLAEQTQRDRDEHKKLHACLVANFSDCLARAGFAFNTACTPSAPYAGYDFPGTGIRIEITDGLHLLGLPATRIRAVFLRDAPSALPQSLQASALWISPSRRRVCFSAEIPNTTEKIRDPDLCIEIPYSKDTFQAFFEAATILVLRRLKETT